MEARIRHRTQRLVDIQDKALRRKERYRLEKGDASYSHIHATHNAKVRELAVLVLQTIQNEA